MVKTCILTNQLFYSWRDGKSDSNFKRVSDCRHILQTINEISQDHGRLVGLEMVDFGAQQFEIEQYKAWTQPICEGELRQTGKYCHFDFGAQQFEIEQYKAWTQSICEGKLRQTGKYCHFAILFAKTQQDT